MRRFGIPGSALQHVETTQRMGSGGKALLQHGPILATKKHCKVRTRCLWATARSPRGDKAPKEPHFSVEQAQISTARAGDRIVFLGAKATIWHQKGHCSIFSGKLTFRFTRDVFQNHVFCPGYLQDTFILYPSISHHHIFQKYFAKTKKPRESEI